MSTQKGNLMRNDSAGRQGPGSSFEGREGDFKGKQPHHPHAHQPFTELSYKPPERTQEAADELKRKRLEKFGPVDAADLSLNRPDAPEGSANPGSQPAQQ